MKIRRCAGRWQSDPGSRRTDLIGSSAAISDVRAVLEQVAQLKTPVLITVPGTAKEIAARHLHKRRMPLWRSIAARSPPR